MSYTANAVTGVAGQRLRSGFDLSNLKPMYAGEPIEVRDREVNFLTDELTLSEVLTSEKFIRFDMLANRVHADEGIALDTPVGLYASGSVLEIRVGRKKFRAYRKTYYGQVN